MKIERTTKVYSSSSSPSRSMLKSSRVGAGIISDASNEVRVSCDSSFISAPFMSSGVSSFRRRITKKITKTTITATTTKTTTTVVMCKGRKLNGAVSSPATPVGDLLSISGRE